MSQPKQSSSAVARRLGRLARQSVAIAALAALPFAAQASPICSDSGPNPSAECIVKLDYCKHTSIVVVLAVRARASGMTEHDNVAGLLANNTNEAWYETYRAVVKDIVRQIYSNDTTYAKLRLRIAPSMALAVSALTAGCNADPTVDTAP